MEKPLSCKFDVLGIAEIHGWIYTADRRKQSIDPNKSHIVALMRAHKEANIKKVALSIGRSTMLYHTQSPLLTRFMQDADRNAAREGDVRIGTELEKECFLSTAIAYAEKNEMMLYAHLCMNRHYGKHSYGSALTSNLAKDEALQEINKDGTVDCTRLCYAAKKVQQERLTILREVVRMGVHAICLDFMRQPPMLKYHPLLTNKYISQTGTDPTNIDPGKQPDAFMRWCQYRADVLTEFVQHVKYMVQEEQIRQKRPITIAVRVPDDGLDANLIAGLDVEVWSRQQLIDELITHPLQWIHGIWVHDVAPYVDIGRRYGIKVFGGANTYAVEGWQFNPVCIARRIKTHYDQGVAGVALYETNDAVIRADVKPVLDHIHTKEDLQSLLADRTWLSAWPIHGLNQNCGMDNHSGFSRDLLSTL